MSIKKVISSKGDVENELLDLFEKNFSLGRVLGKEIYEEQLKPHFDNLIDNINFFIEAPYIDKVYRDSYYTYFSSKLGNYKKDCIRISIFREPISEDDFRDVAKLIELKGKYLGFIILRPLTPSIVGRSVISPLAVKKSDFLSTKALLDSTVDSIKFEIEGFPHSSQDAETISCAETSLWAIMEYFGYKYAEYKPVLPSKIIDTLKKVSSERQVPSRGLNIQQMSYALREFGFGTKIYSKNDFGPEFSRLFSTYIESGIPIITAVENRHAGGSIGHAFLTIGHEKTTDDFIDKLPLSVESDNYLEDIINTKKISFYDHDDIDRLYVFIDDNIPSYCQNKFSTPTSHYSDASWHNCEITYFIVPLYTKIYLEAYQSKNFCKQLLLGLFKIPDGTEIYFRFFLASSRSYKAYIALDSKMHEDVREMILETEMPKFVWVAELSDKLLIKNKQAKGFIILDATEANILIIKPLLIGYFNGEMITVDNNNGELSRLSLPLPVFSIFTNNLKGF